MKFAIASLFLVSCSALQLPSLPKTAKTLGAATVATSALLGSPILTPAATDTTAVVNIDTSNIDPMQSAKILFSHRNQLRQAAKDFVGSVQQLSKDLDGALPPAPEVTAVPPENWKQAIRDALVGQVRLEINKEPVYFEVDSKEGFLTVKVLSPILPKLPLLEPTVEQRASMVIPRAVVTKEPTPTAVTSTSDKPFWEWTFVVPKTDVEVTLPEAAVAFVASAYATTYGWYVVSKELDARAAETRKKANQAKAAARAKAAKAATE